MSASEGSVVSELQAANELCTFIDASPTPFHVVENVSAQLRAAGFSQLHETDAWSDHSGRYFVIRGGSLIAWASGSDSAPQAGFRMIGGHTDSPNLRVKQRHDVDFADGGVVALEPYGGAWLNSWFDRDLSLAGRTAFTDGSTRLVRIDEPLLRIPQLAIHLAEDRTGLKPDPQRHLNAIWTGRQASLAEFVANTAGADVTDLAGFELMAFDTQPSARIGAAAEFVSAPRLDNQVTCFAGLKALLSAADRAPESPVMLALFDHEEIGSTSERGAGSEFLSTVIERVVAASGGDRGDYHRASAASVCVSGDMAHATHPSYADRHEPLHRVALGGGPVLKINIGLRYATDAVGAALFQRACDEAAVPLQRYEHRADLPCGLTIGPLSAARTGILTVDVGAPQLAMHSAREFMAASDVDSYLAALGAFLCPRSK